MRASADLLDGRVNVDPIGVEIGRGVWAENENVEIAPDAQIYGPVWLGEAVKIKDGVDPPRPDGRPRAPDHRLRAQIDRHHLAEHLHRRAGRGSRRDQSAASAASGSKAMVFDGAVIGDNTTVGEGAVIQPGIDLARQGDRGRRDDHDSLIWGSQGSARSSVASASPGLSTST